MRDKKITALTERLSVKHEGDERQLAIIFSDEKKLLVEAPAGYGKTNTMVSKIAFMLLSGQIPNPKKLLALTFSVNAAYKIKKDLKSNLPLLLDGLGYEINIDRKIRVTNYHGFARSILRKYGHKLYVGLNRIDTMQALDDSDPQIMQQTIRSLTYDEAIFLSDYNEAVKSVDFTHLDTHLERYCYIVIDKLLPQGFISYNSILTLTIHLFNIHPTVLLFYKTFYNTVLVDEFQDTNYLSFEMLSLLITDETKVVLLGDSLQRIYGFIGAIPKLLERAETKFALKKIPLEKNYRFASNPTMLLLDHNIRKNAETPGTPLISTDAKVEFTVYKSQSEEALEVVRKSLQLIQADQSSKVAILTKQRGKNIDYVINTLNQNNIPFFYCLFTDDDKDYIKFHNKCHFEFIELLKVVSRVAKRTGKEHIKKVDEFVRQNQSPLNLSLLKLLTTFWDKLFSDFIQLSNDDKISLVKDTFENYGLKQYIEYTDANIILSTVHAAKGLEWNYVILCDMEQESFPNYYGLCNQCLCKSDCKLQVTPQNQMKFLEELSVFYVAVTRARKQVFFTASATTAPDKYGREWCKNISCFMRLPGIIY